MTALLARFRRWRDRRALRQLGPHFAELRDGTCGWCGAEVPVKAGGLGSTPCARCGRPIELYNEKWLFAAEWPDGCRCQVYSLQGQANIARATGCRRHHHLRHAEFAPGSPGFWRKDDRSRPIEMREIEWAVNQAMLPPPAPAEPENAWAPGELEQPYDPADERTHSPL